MKKTSSGTKRRRKNAKPENAEDNDAMSTSSVANSQDTENQGSSSKVELTNEISSNLAKGSDGAAIKGKWTPEQRLALLEAILEYLPTPLPWNEISSKVEGKSNSQCYDQWRKKMLSDIKKFVSPVPEKEVKNKERD